MALVFLMALQSTFHSIGNQWLSVSVNDALCAYRPGAVVHMMDNYTGSEITGSNQFSGINCGSYLPQDGSAEILSDTSLVFHTTGMTDGADVLPIDITIWYTVVDRGLEIRYRLEFLDQVEVLSPLEVDFSIIQWDSLETRNQTAVDERFALDGETGFQRFSGDQLFRLSGGLPEATFIMPNTAKGIAVVLDEETYAYLSLRILDVEAPRENCAGPDLHSVIPAGQVEEYYLRFTMDEFFAPVFLGGHPHGAEHSAGWILDELSFIHPFQGFMWAFSETAQGEEAVSACLISLLDDHPQLNMNWLMLPDGILDGNKDSVWFEPGYEDSWSHWHSTWRFSTEATPEYLQWLRNIQDNVYPWADRVRMGSHGYHHTPNPDSISGGMHEFITFEPDEHQERFRVNMLDLAECGLDTSMVRVIRFPGHRSSLSGLQAVIDHGFTFFCNGWRLTDWYAGKQFRNQWISRFQTPNGRIWGSNSVWWGDYQMMYPYEYLSEPMEKGKFCLLGCHPISMFWVNGGVADPAAYARVDSLITSLENDYGEFIWLFPSQYGDFLEDCYNISVTSMDGTGSLIGLEFNGAVPEGLTFCAFLDPSDVVSSVTLDGTAIPWEVKSGGRLFAVAGAEPQGDHVLTIDMTPMGIQGDQPRSGFALSAVSPSRAGDLSLVLSGFPQGEEAFFTVFDLAGRTVASRRAVPENGSVSIEAELPSGLYCVTARGAGMKASSTAVVIR